jgi:hypothetical protein
MSKARGRRWRRSLWRVERCDGCGRACTPDCRTAVIRTPAVDRVQAMGLLR